MTGDAMWIGPSDDYRVGQTGFLVTISHDTAGWTRHDLRDTPAHTNQSRQPRLHGWCGTDNNIATYGAGIVRVERVARNGRALVRQLKADDARAVLDELGYPELADQMEQ